MEQETEAVRLVQRKGDNPERIATLAADKPRKKSWKRRLTRLESLNWTTPAKVLPHGVTGLISMISGAFLVYCALRGMAHKPDGSLEYVSVSKLYLFSTFLNALSGFLMSDRAGKSAASMFKQASAMQILLVYFAWRFLSEESLYARGLLEAVDCVCSLALVTVLLLISSQTWAVAVKMFGNAVAASILAGCAALFLLSGYPLQLAFGSSEWLHCVVDAYPLQRVGFVAYVYIPATFAFGAMMFGATLLARKVIDGVFFASFFVGLILSVLFSTVLMQEVHIPWVSTQKLFIDCPKAPPGSFTSLLANTLDTSRLAQSFLTHILGFQPTNSSVVSM